MSKNPRSQFAPPIGPSTRMNADSTQLSCLVLASNAEHHKLVSLWLGVTRQVSSVTAVQDAESLCKQLRSAPCHLCIIVALSGNDQLPPCIQLYPNTRVLVLTASRKVANRSEWFEQGATDVVSIKKTLVVQHAISRLTNECELHQKKIRLESRALELEQELQQLRTTIAQSKTNDNSKNKKFHDSADLRRARETISVYSTSKHQPTNIIDTSKSSTPVAQPNAIEIARLATMDRFQKAISKLNQPRRLTAMLVRISVRLQVSSTNSSIEPLDDKAVQRALTVLSQIQLEGQVLGQLSSNTLLLTQSQEHNLTARRAANHVRTALDTLDSPLKSVHDVHVHTLSLSATSTLSAQNVIERLEAHKTTESVER